ncbi:22473_t:CDS:2, partial [Racocetra persica]
GLRPKIDVNNTPQSIIKLIRRCWRKNPKERPIAIELLNELRTYREKDHEIWKEIEKIEENKNFNISPQEASLKYETSKQAFYTSKRHYVPETSKHDYNSETESLILPSDPSDSD